MASRSGSPTAAMGCEALCDRAHTRDGEKALSSDCARLGPVLSGILARRGGRGGGLLPLSLIVCSRRSLRLLQTVPGELCEKAETGNTGARHRTIKLSKRCGLFLWFIFKGNDAAVVFFAALLKPYVACASPLRISGTPLTGTVDLCFVTALSLSQIASGSSAQEGAVAAVLSVHSSHRRIGGWQATDTHVKTSGLCHCVEHAPSSGIELFSKTTAIASTSQPPTEKNMANRRRR